MQSAKFNWTLASVLVTALMTGCSDSKDQSQEHTSAQSERQQSHAQTSSQDNTKMKLSDLSPKDAIEARLVMRARTLWVSMRDSGIDFSSAKNAAVLRHMYTVAPDLEYLVSFPNTLNATPRPSDIIFILTHDRPGELSRAMALRNGSIEVTAEYNLDFLAALISNEHPR